MVNFLMDPTGDIPWDEDPTAVDVVHIDTEDVRTDCFLLLLLLRSIARTLGVIISVRSVHM